MKKLIYGGLFLATVGIGIVGCKKEVGKPDSVQTQSNEEVMSTKAMTKEFVDLGGELTGCYTTQHPNCTNAVTITAKRAQLVSDLFTTIENNDQAGAADLINHNYDAIVDIFDRSYVDSFLSGNHALEVRGPNGDGERFVIFKNVSTGENDHVTPLK